MQRETNEERWSSFLLNIRRGKSFLQHFRDAHHSKSFDLISITAATDKQKITATRTTLSSCSVMNWQSHRACYLLTLTLERYRKLHCYLPAIPPHRQGSANSRSWHQVRTCNYWLSSWKACVNCRFASWIWTNL